MGKGQFKMRDGLEEGKAGGAIFQSMATMNLERNHFKEDIIDIKLDKVGTTLEAFQGRIQPQIQRFQVSWHQKSGWKGSSFGVSDLRGLKFVRRFVTTVTIKLFCDVRQSKDGLPSQC